MKAWRASMLSLALLCGGLSGAWAQDKEPIQHEFVIRHFKTEGGIDFPEARIVYGTYGKLNAAADNVVLLPSHYMADMHGYEWLIGSRTQVSRRDHPGQRRGSSSAPQRTMV